MEVAQSMLDSLFRILTILFNDVFTPILLDVLMVFWDSVMTYAVQQLSYLAYLVLVFLCGILDGLENVINIFVGTQKIIVDNEPMTLMEMVFRLDVISRAFLLITCVAVGMCILFTIFATVRSMSSMTLEDKNPITHVLKQVFRAAVTFMMVPFLCVFLLQVSTALTIQIQTSVLNQSGGTKDASTGTYVFLISSLRAGRVEPNNLGSFMSRLGSGEDNYLEPDIEDELRKEYLSGEKDYRKLGDSGMDFSTAKIDYVMGFVAVIFMIILFAGLIIQFVRRLLELVMLYLVSPFFVAVIPVDDGEMFKRWRDMFVAKFLSSFGVIFAIKIFLLLLPLIFSSKLDLGSSYLPGSGIVNEGGNQENTGNQNSVSTALDKSGLGDMAESGMIDNVMYYVGLEDEMKPTLESSLIDSILKLLFMMGGVLAIYKSQTMILEVLNPKAAEDTKEAIMLAMAMSMKAAKTAKDVGTTGAGLAAGAVTGGAGAAAMAGGKAGMAAGKMAASTAGKTVKSASKKALKSAASTAGNTVSGAARKTAQGSDG